MNLLEGLNTAQYEAVKTTEGPVMVMAGAGAGKTKVLTTRISYIISELGIPQNNILAVTFTNKAANEMKERIANILEIDTRYMWVSTFHSFCARLLRMEINSLPPFNNRFNIADEEDSLKVVKEVMANLGIDTKEYKPAKIRGLISRSKNFTDFNIKDDLLKSVFLEVSKAYQEYLANNNILDFDDLIIKTIELFKNNPEILKKYQEKFQYILVDEFQDTNALQYSMVFMLSARHHNIFVVGDDFQSIYSFRGAKIENIRRFRKDFLETKLILLEENYRSTNQILNLANTVIKNNPNQIKKTLFTNNPDGDKPFYYQASTSYDEVMFVIDKIKSLVASGDNYNDIAILYRANYISRNFEDLLIRHQIPYIIYGGLSFFARKEIKDMIAYLRLIINYDDNFSFRRIINEPKRKIGPTLIEKLEAKAMELKSSLFNAIPSYEGKGQGADALKEFKKMIESIKALIDNEELPDLIDILLKETGYENYLRTTLDEDQFSDKIQNIKELKSVLKEAAEFYEGDSNITILDKFLADLALRTDNENDKFEKANSVRLSTYHQVKGLEFKDVFMVAMEQGIFPSFNSVSDTEIEEERRVCYVGITRAKKNLYISSASSRLLFGSESYMMPSIFIREMKDELYKAMPKVEAYDYKVTSKKKEVKKEEPKSNVEYKAGDKVNHKAFGDGIVVSVQGQTLTVAFAVGVGIKKLLANHPSIRKI